MPRPRKSSCGLRPAPARKRPKNYAERTVQSTRCGTEGSAKAYTDGGLVRELAIGESFGSVSAVSHGSFLETVLGRSVLELYVLDCDDFTQVIVADRGFEERIRLLLMAHQASREEWLSTQAGSSFR